VSDCDKGTEALERREGRRVLVTGGTRGIGRAIARRFLEERFAVAINYSQDRAGAEQTVEEFSSLPSPCLAVRADVSVSRDVEAMFGRIKEAWGGIDILVNNAGVVQDGLLIFEKEASWDRVIGTNLKGVYLCCRQAVRTMVANRWGRIVNIISPSALMGRQGQTSYSAAKGGVLSFTKSLARELGRSGVTVNAVMPGLIDTDMTRKMDPRHREGLVKQIPVGRMGQPEDVAHCVFFLASPQAAYVTGKILGVDGGLT
jgi:3-oxoacyl-[acyl-carrier protein] reductase